MGDTYLPNKGNEVGDTFQTTIAPDTGIVYLLSGVPLDIKQKNQMWFNSKEEQHTYFDLHYTQKKIKGTYQDLHGVIRADYNYEELINYNYVMYQNTMYGDKWFYGFITDIAYRSTKSSYITFKLDAFQTYFLDVNYRWTYVKAMHHEEWRTSDGGTGYTVPLEKNIDEGLDYGQEYDVVKQIQLTTENNPNVKWVIITATAQFEKASVANDGSSSAFGSAIGGVPTPFYMYCLPIDLNNPTNTGVEPTFTNGRGETFYAGDDTTQDTNAKRALSSVNELQYALAKYSKFAGKVQSITISDVPPFPVSGTFPSYSSTENLIVTVGAKVGTVSTKVGQDKVSFDMYLNLIRVYKQWGANVNRFDLGNVYKYFPKTSPYSKLLNSPYSVIEITDFKGHTMTLKPEYFNTSHLVIDTYSNTSWDSKIGYSVKNYNIGVEPYGGNEGQINGEINWENTIFDTTSGDIPIATDQTALYLQSHKNAMIAEKTNLEETNRTTIKSSQRAGQTGIAGAMISGAVQGATTGGAGGAVAGSVIPGAGTVAAGVAGAVGGAVLGAIRPALNYTSTQYGNALRQQTSERNLARSQNAKLADISNMPPQISGQGNNTIFEMNNEIAGVYLIFKQIKPEYWKKIQDYFHMFGYQLNELVNLSTKQAMTSRKYWNYIETQNMEVNGMAPVPLMDELEAVFDKGVTLWHVTNGVEVGDYSKENSEV